MKAVGRKRYETICCVCHRKKGKHGWTKGKIHSLADLSHGYCPECYRLVMIKYGLETPLERRVPELRHGEALG